MCNIHNVIIVSLKRFCKTKDELYVIESYMYVVILKI